MTRPGPLRPYLRRAGALALGAVAVNLLLLGVGRLAGGSFVVPPFTPGGPETPVGVAPVVVVTLLPLVVGFAAAALPVARRAPRAVRAVQVVGAVLALLSVLSPVVAGPDAVTTVCLVLMHLVAGSAFVAGLQPWASRAASDDPVRGGTAQRA